MRIVYHDSFFTSTIIAPIGGISFSVFLCSGASDDPAVLFRADTVLPPNVPGIAKALSAAMGWACPHLLSIRTYYQRGKPSMGRILQNRPTFYPDSDGFGPFTATQNKRGYAHLTERGAEIPGRAKNDCTAVKLAQEGKLKRWYVKTAKGK